MRNINWQRDGWREEHWEQIETAAGHLWKIAHDLDAAVGGGGGGVQPSEVGAVAKRLQALTDRLTQVCSEYGNP